MSGFLSRWASRKAAARLEAATRPDPTVDLEALPDVATLDAASDFSAFLQAGIPAALQTQALRVLWEQDATISGFRGMAEYDWDFNAEGYGRLAAGDDVAALLRRIVMPAPESPARELADAALAEPQAAPAPVIACVPPTAATPPEPATREPALGELAATEPAPVLPPRRHGGALPDLSDPAADTLPSPPPVVV